MNTRKTWAAALAVAAGVAAALPPAARAELNITPSIGVNETWTDNYFLVGANEPKNDELITRANAELLVTQGNQRVHTRLQYDIDTALDGPEKGALFQDGRLDVGAEVLRDWFFVDAAGAYGQYSVDPRIRRNPDHAFPSRDTLTDVGSGTLTGALRHNFSRVHFDASYSTSTVRYAREPDSAVGLLQDSRYQDATVGLSSVGDSRLYWSASYEERRVKYDGGLEVKRDIAGLDLAFAVAAPLKLLAHGGLETDPRVIDDSGGLDQETYSGGFAWIYRRGELRLMAGHSAYGQTYDGSLSLNGRVVRADVSYEDQTTTQVQEFLPYLATDAQGNPITVPGNVVLSGLDDAFGRLTPDVFHQQRLRGRVSLIGRLTDIELGFRDERRSYLLSGSTDRVHGANVTIRRTLGPRSRAELSARYDTVIVEGGDRLHDQAYSLSFYRQLGQRLQLFASASRANLSSGDPYVANWIALGLQMTFGRGGGATPTQRTIGVPSPETR